MLNACDCVCHTYVHLHLQISRTILEYGRVQEIVDGLKDVLTAGLIRTKERQQQKASRDFDEEELELLKEEDVEEEAIFLQVNYISSFYVAFTFWHS